MDMDFIAWKPLTRFQADDFVADDVFNDIQFVFLGALAADHPFG